MDYLQLQNLFISIHEIFFAKYNKVKRIPFFDKDKLDNRRVL
jgi:hypothetical protein